ncbi:hypothetical protein ACFYO1_24280 [Nocardia sp. NPDC006044]|uniref:hypothetical protein n=1 Tax=Nocardia sp. NPDC006044 TaxID=3364306 RepID=UPI0036C6B540
MADDMSDKAKAQKDLLWSLYADIRVHARHAEALRSNAVNYVLVIASALTAVVLADRRVERAELPLCLAVVLIGLFGLAFVASYTELYQRNRRRAERIRKLLDNRYFTGGDVSLSKILHEADQVHETTRLYRWSRRTTGSSHRFWLLLPVVVVVVGASLAAAAI